MLTLILGRAGSGKTSHIYEALRQNILVGSGGQILLVPEQFSMTPSINCLRCAEAAPASMEKSSVSPASAAVSLPKRAEQPPGFWMAAAGFSL